MTDIQFDRNPIDYEALINTIRKIFPEIEKKENDLTFMFGVCYNDIKENQLYKHYEYVGKRSELVFLAARLQQKLLEEMTEAE